MSETPKNKEVNGISLEDFVIIEGAVYRMGDISGTRTKFLPLPVTPEVAQKVMCAYSEVPDGYKARKRNNARFIPNGSGYMIAPTPTL